MGGNGAHQGYFAVISGQRRGAVAAMLRGGLWLLSVVYCAGSAVRRAWDRFRAGRVEVPVISVGNLTVGGTGKTPLVAWIARRLAETGHRPLVVSRGYKRAGAGPGDEAADLRRRLPPSVRHIEAVDRIGAIRADVQSEPRDVVVLDDGFQHLRLERDLDIVTIDATWPFGYGHLLPRGLLREPVCGLARADAVVITRSDQVPAEELGRVEDRVRRHLGQGATVLHATHAPVRLVSADGASQPVEALGGARVYAFSGLANPAAFHRTLEDLGAALVGTRVYDDHHHYTSGDVAAIVAAARAAEARRIVTTTKDFVKVTGAELASAWPESPAVAALEIEIQFREGPAALDDLLRGVVGGG